MSEAIVYIAYGDQYLKEVKRSLASLNGQYPCVVCTSNGRVVDGTIPFRLFERQTEHWFLDRCHYFNHIFLSTIGYDRLLFLDSDTFICGNISGYFDALDRYDIVSTQAIAKQTVQFRGIPSWFPEIHCGAFAIRRTEAIQSLLDLWLEIYQQKPNFWGNDQPALRQALWEMPEINIGILPIEYCFRYRWGGLLSQQVVLLHGKEHNTPYEEIAEQVNKKPGNIRIFHRRALA